MVAHGVPGVVPPDHVLTSNDHGKLVAQLKKVYSVDIQVLNRGNTSLLKLSLVPTHHPDGSVVTSEWLHKTIARHPKWADVEFVPTPTLHHSGE